MAKSNLLVLLYNTPYISLEPVSFHMPPVSEEDHLESEGVIVMGLGIVMIFVVRTNLPIS